MYFQSRGSPFSYEVFSRWKWILHFSLNVILSNTISVFYVRGCWSEKNPYSFGKWLFAFDFLHKSTCLISNYKIHHNGINYITNTQITNTKIVYSDHVWKLWNPNNDKLNIFVAGHYCAHSYIYEYPQI